ncbi:glycosyltransferase [Flavobacterium sp. SM2513]|uniref:glycosyltransferase n=1 Tax=Flavobacterium sp. SM2513 TaxID=3424766 RepID=UPI003D7F2C4A
MNRKIKILYTIPNFDTAGSGKVLFDLAKGLDKEQFDVAIACSSTKGAFFQEVKNLGLPVYIRSLTKPIKPYYSLLFRIRENIKFIKTHQIDIVHSWHWSSDWTEVVASRLGGAKFVYTKKAMTWGNVHWKIRSYLSDFIITINEEMKSYFPTKKGQQLIPLGLDTEYYNPELFQKKETAVFKIITVANLVPVKGIEVLIDAIKILNNADVYLEIVGDDRTEYASELSKIIKELGLQKQISILGKHKDVRPFLGQADLYIIPSKKEGMPMALVEAMCMGVPVLGSNITGINFVLKEFPELLFEVGNSSDLAERINEVMRWTTEQREEKGGTLRNYVVSHFSYASFIKAHEELYTKLAR